MLEAHATTLRSLTLGVIVMTPEWANLSLVYGSWDSIINFLHNSLKLDYVTFQGIIANSGSESWRADDKIHSSECLRNRIERFVVSGGEYPLRSPTEEDFQAWRTLREHGLRAEDRIKVEAAYWEGSDFSDESWLVFPYSRRTSACP